MYIRKRDSKTWTIGNEKSIERALKHSGEQGVDGTVTVEVLALFYYSKICRYCGVVVGRRTRTIDHMMPLSRGGKHSVSNLALACRNCNNKKADMTLVEFIIEHKAGLL